MPYNHNNSHLKRKKDSVLGHADSFSNRIRDLEIHLVDFFFKLISWLGEMNSTIDLINDYQEWEGATKKKKIQKMKKMD